MAGVASQSPVAVYLTPDGKHVLIRMRVDDQGQDAAAAILQASNPSPAFVHNERRFGNGGIQWRLCRRMCALSHNKTLMLELGFRGTPGILFGDANVVVRRHAAG